MNYRFADFINPALQAGEKRREDGEPFQWLSRRYKTVKTVFRLLSSLHPAGAGC